MLFRPEILLNFVSIRKIFMYAVKIKDIWILSNIVYVSKMNEMGNRQIFLYDWSQIIEYLRKTLFILCQSQAI